MKRYRTVKLDTDMSEINVSEDDDIMLSEDDDINISEDNDEINVSETDEISVSEDATGNSEDTVEVTEE